MSVLESRGPRRPLLLRSRSAFAGLALVACGIAERHVDESDAAGTSGGGAGRGGATFDRGGMFGSGGSGTTVGGSVGYGTGGLGSTAPSKGGYPGKNFGGAMPAIDTCQKILDIMPTCSPAEAVGGAGGDAAGSAPGGAGGDATSGAGAGGKSGGGVSAGGKSGGGASSAWCVPDGPTAGIGSDVLVLDDFEDGDDATSFFLSGRGAWFAVNDGSGQQFPLPCTLPSELEALRFGSHFAMHTYGQGFIDTPGGYSLVGMSVKRGSACNEPIDASSFAGVQFWARGVGLLRFFVGTVDTNPFADYGTCADRCYDAHGYLFPLTEDWQFVRVPFTALVQEGWGSPAFFDPTKVLTLEWSAKEALGSYVPARCFDFWIDDVAFYR